MAKQAKTPFETVTSQLGQLTRSELSELADMVAALSLIHISEPTRPY